MDLSLKKTTLKGSSFNFSDAIRLVNEIIEIGISKRASDIHIRENNKKAFLEYRIEGILIEEKLPCNIFVQEIISRLKIMAKLNVAEKRLPQDSSFEYEYKGKRYDIRVAILPTINGESVVLRILNSTLENIELENLGFDEFKIDILERVCNKNCGLILITGPTGSGKSTTLLSLTNIIKKSCRKIVSIEDPVENKDEDIVQIQVKEEIGLSFENILRTVLRSDPDVIIISEIRDEITASIAIRASLTGHLVLATLHTNDVISTFSRLIDMKIPKYLILDSLLCILSQKLIRLDDYIRINKRLCVSEILEIDEKAREIFSNYNKRNDLYSSLKKLGFKTIDDEIENLKFSFDKEFK